MDKSSVPGLSKGLDIIQLVADNENISFNKIKEHLNIGSSSLSRLLKVLLSYDYIRKNSKGRYTLSYKILSISNKYSIWSILLEEADPILKEISERFDITVLFFRVSDKEIISMSKHTAQYNIAMQNPGKAYEHNIFAPWGILSLTQKSELEIQKTYQCIKQNGFWGKKQITYNEFLQEIQFARENGYSFDTVERGPDFYRYAAPITNVKGKVIAALGAGTFAKSVSETDRYEIVDILKEKAAYLSSLIKS